MPDPQLQIRGGRNIGVEANPVLIQAAGASEVSVAISGSPTTLLEAALALRTPATGNDGQGSGIAISSEAVDYDLNVSFVDDQNNEILIAAITVAAGASAPLVLDANAFTVEQPLILNGGEKLVVRVAPTPP